MNIKLFCFTEDNEVIALCTNQDLEKFLRLILMNHTYSTYKDFKSTQEIINYLENDYDINVTSLSLDIEEVK